MKPNKKIFTDDKSIKRAEDRLGIKYPEIIKNKLKLHNGFYWGYFRFYCVYDEEDKFHTFDDVVRENEKPQGGWKQFLPEGYVSIANEDLLCLVVNTKKDGIVYLYDHETGEIEIFSKNDDELAKKLDEQDSELADISKSRV